MKKLFYTFYTTALLFFTTAYTYAASQSTNIFVKCEGSECGFQDIFTSLNNLVSFLLFKIASPVAAIMIAVAGWKILTAGGNMSSLESGKKLLWAIVRGYLIALAAWLIVKTIFQLANGNFTFFLG